jgi:hypothetical protein
MRGNPQRACICKGEHFSGDLLHCLNGHRSSMLHEKGVNGTRVQLECYMLVNSLQTMPMLSAFFALSFSSHQEPMNQIQPSCTIIAAQLMS